MDKERSCVGVDLPTCELWRGCASSILVSECRKVLCFLYQSKRKFAMPPRRRDRETPDPPEEREMLRRRGRQMTDLAM
jgi:hypothetical protein